MTTILTLLIKSPLFAILLGPIATAIGNVLQGLIPVYDKAPNWVKQFAAVAFGFVFAVLIHFIPAAIPAVCTATATGTVVTDACLTALFSGSFLSVLLNAAITGLMAIAAKHGQQATATKAAVTTIASATGTAAAVKTAVAATKK